MVRLLALSTILSLAGFFVAVPIQAQEASPTVTTRVRQSLTPTASPSASPEATVSAVVEEITPRPKEDLTQPKEAKSRLERVLDANPTGPLSPANFIAVAIRYAVDRGVPANTIVLMILFPLVAALIAFARHIIGLQGFGIFTPAVVSVAFLATGVTVGFLLFAAILIIATLARVVLKKLKMPSMPRMALLIWFVSLGILAIMLLAPTIRLEGLVAINIFPILLLILLAETFTEVQITRTFRAAIELTLETLFLALISFFVLSIESLQEWVLVHPETTILAIALLDILIGRYTGLRLLERLRFRQLLEA